MYSFDFMFKYCFALALNDDGWKKKWTTLVNYFTIVFCRYNVSSTALDCRKNYKTNYRIDVVNSHT